MYEHLAEPDQLLASACQLVGPFTPSLNPPLVSFFPRSSRRARCSLSELCLVLNKKTGGKAEAYEEFEEDIIDEDDVAAPTTAAPPTSSSTSRGPAERYALAQAELAPILALSSHHLPSLLPSPALLTSVLSFFPLPELPATLATLALYRSKALPIDSPRQSLSFIQHCAKLGIPETAVRVLADRRTYGLDLSDHPNTSQAIDKLYFALARKSVQGTPEERKDLTVQTGVLRAIEELQRPEGLPSYTGQVVALSLFLEGTQAEAVGTEAVKAAFALAAEQLLPAVLRRGEEIVKDVSKLPKANRTRAPLRQRMLVIGKVLGERGGQEAEAAWFLEAADKVHHRKA